MVCFDTDLLIAYLQKDQDAVRKLEQLKAGGEVTPYTTMINVAELYKGVYRSKNRQKEIVNIANLLRFLKLLTLDQESARLVGELDSVIKSNAIGELDLIIASIALANHEKLVTRNIKHFTRVPGLQVESW